MNDKFGLSTNNPLGIVVYAAGGGGSSRTTIEQRRRLQREKANSIVCVTRVCVSVLFFLVQLCAFVWTRMDGRPRGRVQWNFSSHGGLDAAAARLPFFKMFVESWQLMIWWPGCTPHQRARKRARCGFQRKNQC